MNVSELVEQLNAFVHDACNALDQAESSDDLNQEKNRQLGKKGRLQEIMALLPKLANEDKKALGQASNRAKQAINQHAENRLAQIAEIELRQRLSKETIDVSLPGLRSFKTHGHPIKQVEYDLVDLFAALGFEVAEGPEMETDFFNFEALNFPADHPARDSQDTFLLQDQALLRTHTSPVQIRSMLAYPPPLRIIAPGRVYRCDNDVTHSPVFHQVEGLFVDTDVTFADLKGVLEAFIHQYFGPSTPIRLRSSFFPFTEPSAEIDIGCVFCQQQGCRICKQSGWIEILGSGMVDPEVLRAAMLDPDVYSGFAFGMGIERIAMLKYSISDIRMLYSGNVGFLSQF